MSSSRTGKFKSTRDRADNTLMTTVSIKFKVGPSRLAMAMTLAAIESSTDVSYGSYEQDERLTEKVQSIKKAAAMSALRTSFEWYGVSGWPDLPRCANQAYAAALVKAHAWLGTEPKQSSAKSVGLHEI